MKKVVKIIIGILVILLAIEIYIRGIKHTTIQKLFFPNTSDKLEKIGYTKEEINTIEGKLEKESIKYLLTIDYEKQILSYLQNEDFQEKNFISYLEEEKKSSLSIEDTIFLVNHQYYDSKKEYTENMVAFMKEEYYIDSLLDRYVAYQEKEKNKEIRSIVEKVNTNRDYSFYTNTQQMDTDLSYKMLVNKYYYLDKSYTPSLITQTDKYGKSGERMEKETYEQFKKMYEEAKKDNLTLYVNSAYRSYEEQKEVYDYYEKIYGKNVINYAAKPGYSEHQTGLALDIFKPGTTTKTFEKTKEYAWLIKNAHKYGFILRYPKGKEDITGYDYESWHYRYVGVDIATEIYQKDITFDEYYAYFLK